MVNVFFNTIVLYFTNARTYKISRRDFADPRTLKIEFGISHEMEQYDKNFKVRRLLGTMDDSVQSQRRGTSTSTSMKSP